MSPPLVRTAEHGAHWTVDTVTNCLPIHLSLPPVLVAAAQFSSAPVQYIVCTPLRPPTIRPASCDDYFNYSTTWTNKSHTLHLMALCFQTQIIIYKSVEYFNVHR